MIYVLFFSNKNTFKRLEDKNTGLQFIAGLPDDLRDDLGARLVEFDTRREYEEFVKSVHSRRNGERKKEPFEGAHTPGSNMVDLTAKVSPNEDAHIPVVTRSPTAFTLPKFVDVSATEKPKDPLPDVKLPARPFGETNNDNNDNNYAHTPIVRAFQKRKQKEGIRLDVHCFIDVPPTFLAVPIVMEFVDPRKNFTHWLFRPPKFMDVIETILLEGRPSLGRFYQNMFRAPIRPSNGDDSADSIPYTSKAGNDMQLIREGMATFISNGLTADEIMDLVRHHLGKISANPSIQYCYKMAVAYEGASDTMIRDLSPIEQNLSEGRFWRQWQGSLESINLVEHHHLSGVFLSSQIPRVLSAMSPDLDPNNATPQKLPKSISSFAFNV